MEISRHEDELYLKKEDKSGPMFHLLCVFNKRETNDMFCAVRAGNEKSLGQTHRRGDKISLERKQTISVKLVSLSGCCHLSSCPKGTFAHKSNSKRSGEAALFFENNGRSKGDGRWRTAWILSAYVLFGATSELSTEYVERMWSPFKKISSTTNVYCSALCIWFTIVILHQISDGCFLPILFSSRTFFFSSVEFCF